MMTEFETDNVLGYQSVFSGKLAQKTNLCIRVSLNNLRLRIMSVVKNKLSAYICFNSINLNHLNRNKNIRQFHCISAVTFGKGKQIKLSQCLIKRHAIMAYRWLNAYVYLQAFLRARRKLTWGTSASPTWEAELFSSSSQTFALYAAGIYSNQYPLCTTNSSSIQKP
jgi:hypothetical protein